MTSLSAQASADNAQRLEFCETGTELHALAERLFPICRSLTGAGVRQTLAILQRHMVPYTLTEVPTGESVFDWTVPKEWSIKGATLTDPSGATVLDFADNNLHVVGYSMPTDIELDLEQLQPHLHSLPEQPDAIPYVTSYYRENWGFCLPDAQRKTLVPGRYRAHIESELFAGSMTYAEFVLPGSEPSEVLISSYVCHPSMANNELSGPLVASAIARYLTQKPRRHTYRVALFPETLGCLAYLSRRLQLLRERMVAGFHLSCIGDERGYSFVATPDANTLADRVARHILRATDVTAVEYDHLYRGSDERQYCAPNVDLPVVHSHAIKIWHFPRIPHVAGQSGLGNPRGPARRV